METFAKRKTKPKRPGSGNRKKARAFPKGRQVQPDARKDVQKLLKGKSLARDLLIEHLHLIQDKYGHLSAAHLAALAEEMKLAMAEVYEVATFYHHFDVVREGEDAPPEVTIRVCDSLSCEMAGAKDIIKSLGDKAPKYVRVVHAPCMGLCDKAPAAAIGKNYTGNVSVASLLKAAKDRDIKAKREKYQSFDAYVKGGGYKVLKDLRKGKQTPEQVVETLLEAGLRGLGGAGFPSGQKWKFVRAAEGPRYMCINGDEGEPGTFKDKLYLETKPHQFLEGMLIGAWGVDAKAVYIYLRDEYPAIRDVLLKEISVLEKKKIIEPGYVHLRRGAGAYICGEESAMIESIEGKRGLPRHRPPYVAQVGLFDRPTLVHNVETVFWMPEILAKGADWFIAQGREGHKGNRSYSVSGRVNKPGVVLTAAGATAEELIEACGGMLDGHTFKGFLPGGPSGGIMPAKMGNLPLDFGQLEKHGHFVGSHAVVILSDKDHMRDVSVNLLKFFEDESCGQCTPCRVGCEKAVKLMGEKKWNTKLLGELSTAMADASICGLGQAAPNPIKSVMKYFKKEVS
ncbi:MAG: NAD(P)H-dependent oxidoreductase subunit E [Rhodospirillales bacterium]|nr:NAD(P)H-dependent oxidoreductase subunit E [Rhodospirillales bacterium]MBO6787055.1 NAD(P)H-dependent oxidoreductase subunit E [Rhodospirillales bacterium]